MKLREILNVVENGEYISEKERLEIEKRIKQIKAYYKEETIYFTVQYQTVWVSLVAVFTNFEDYETYVMNSSEHDYIQLLKY